MKPFLEYGWQPQVMAVDGAVQGDPAPARLETYDLAADPGETRDLARERGSLPRAVRKALEDYPVPSPAAARAPDDSRRGGEAASWRASATSAPARRRSCARTRRGRPT